MWMFVAAGPLAHMHVRQQAATQACTQGGSTCNPPICTVIQCTPRPQSRLVQGDCCRNPLKLSMLLPAVLQCSNVLCHASRSLPEFKARQRGLLTTSMQQRPPPCCGPSHCTLPCIPPPPACFPTVKARQRRLLQNSLRPCAGPPCATWSSWTRAMLLQRPRTWRLSRETCSCSWRLGLRHRQTGGHCRS